MPNERPLEGAGGSLDDDVLRNNMQISLDLSKFRNFETHVLDLGLNGRGMDVYGLLWG